MVMPSYAAPFTFLLDPSLLARAALLAGAIVEVLEQPLHLDARIGVLAGALYERWGQHRQKQHLNAACRAERCI
jgi:hypothetical protein